MGGPPKTSTPKDQRLKTNNPNAGKKPATTPAKPPVQKGMSKGGKC